MKAAERSEKAKKRLDGILRLRPELNYIWMAWVQLYNATGGVITYQEIASYCKFNGVLTPFEVDAIMTINRVKNND